MYKRITQYFYAIKNLKIRQIIFRVKKNFIKKFPIKSELNDYVISEHIPIKLQKFSYLKKNNKKNNFIELFNKRFLKKKKINWNNKKFTDLERYHLNYFDFLNKANKHEVKLYTYQIKDWIKKNKKLNLKSLDPYPTSLRIVNWIKFLSLYKIVNKEINFNLNLQVKHLYNNIEYDIDGNHLISNAKALIFASLYFQDKKLFKNAEKIYLDCLNDQTLMDGAHFERSPMYHSIICNDLLEVIDICKKNKDKFVNFENIKILENYFKKYINWYLFVTNFDGSPPFFNDTNLSNSFNLNYLIEKAEKILKKNFLVKNNQTKLIKYLKYSGFLIYKNLKKKIFFIADVGSIKSNFQPGHSHAGIFSFELSYANQRFIVNTGVSTYENNLVRLYEKSSLSHNTLSLNKSNNQDVWSSFRVGKRTNVKLIKFTKNKHLQTFTFKHNGFNKHIHQREYELKESSIRILDKIYNYRKRLKILSHINLHPNIQTSDKMFRYKKLKIRYKFFNCRKKIIDGYWSPKFYQKYKNKRIRLLMNSTGNQESLFIF